MDVDLSAGTESDLREAAKMAFQDQEINPN